MELALAPLVMLPVLAIEAAVVGGAFALGAWVVWRLLEQRRFSPPRPPSERGVSIPAVFVALAVIGAALFAFGARTLTPVPWRFGALSFVPFLTLALLACGLVWLVRRALRGE